MAAGARAEGSPREGTAERGLASLFSGPLAFGRFPVLLLQQRGLRPADPLRKHRPAAGRSRGAELCPWFSAVCSGSRRGWPPASCAAAKRKSGWIPTKPMRSPTLTRVSNHLSWTRPCYAWLVLPCGKGMRQAYGKRLFD